MFNRLTRHILAKSADLEDIIGVATLFFVLFLGLTFSGAT